MHPTGKIYLIPGYFVTAFRLPATVGANPIMMTYSNNWRRFLPFPELIQHRLGME